ncbi:MAG: hypothetical protein ACK47E_16155 [Cyclobacteriaceae bacterium]
MKKGLLAILIWLPLLSGAQDFAKNLTTARSSYSAGRLEDTRFALEQMLVDLDIVIGKEIIKLLPTKVASLNYNAKEDNVTGGSGTVTGLFVERRYGAETKTATINVFNNSPEMSSINTILSMPLIGGMMRDENQKVIKIQGYKSLLNKIVDSDTGKTNYELQVQMNNTLLTVKMDDTSEQEIAAVANGLQLSKIAQLAQ